MPCRAVPAAHAPEIIFFVHSECFMVELLSTCEFW